MTDNEWLVETEWSIPSEYGQEKQISAKMVELLAELHHFDNRSDDMITAVTEACLNALEHGNKLDKERRVRVRVNVSAAKAVYRIFDKGPGFDYTIWDTSRIAETVVKRKLNEDNPRGWGLKLMLTLADQVRFGSEAGAFYTEIEFTNK